MRLLDTTRISLVERHGDKVPKYAILSHCWQETGDVTFEALQSGKGIEMSGYPKVKKCCSQAAKDGWDYAWIDSCCINKDSSSELSEAINSMFRWYREAQICYVYLADVLITTNDKHERNSQLRNSRWFTRGWTLQELLAPKKVVFFDSKWETIGQKDNLKDLLTSITGIQDLDKFEDTSVAIKMSWASKRRTTRVEDEAYCLMGLFDVYMTPIYGEGTNAFLRLQLEILQKSDGESIFAWTDVGASLTRSRGLLAPRPAAFINSGDIQRSNFTWSRGPYWMTNKGLRLEWALVSPPEAKIYDPSVAYRNTFLAPLDCSRSSKPDDPLVLALQDIGRGQFARIFSGSLASMDISTEGPFSSLRDFTQTRAIHHSYKEKYVLWAEEAPTKPRVYPRQTTPNPWQEVRDIESDSEFFEYSKPDAYSDEPYCEFVPGTQVIFVKQDESHVRQKLCFKIWTDSLLQNRFSFRLNVTHSYILQGNGDSYWGKTCTDKQELCLVSDYGAAAILFSHKVLGHFVVVLSTWLNQPGVHIGSEDDKNLEKIVKDHMSTPEWTWDGHHSSTRILRSGKVVEATLSSEQNKKEDQDQREWDVDFKLGGSSGVCCMS